MVEGTRILVVTDSPDEAGRVEACLKDAGVGAEVVAVGSAAEAVARAGKEAFHLVALDPGAMVRLCQTIEHTRNDDVVAIVSHDLRNPLFRIYAAAGELIEMAPPETHRFVEVIRRSAKHMNRLIQDLLDVTRAESGHLSLERMRHEVAGVVQEAVEMLAPVAAQKQITVEQQVPPGLEVPLDRVRMVQVLSNLLDNAIKFAQPGTSVKIAVEDREDDVAFVVSDRGSGIAGDHLPRIFDRFWQARRRRTRGAGLGLAIARGIVEAHGGTIGVESRLGEGSTFTVALPKHPRLTPAENSAAETAR